MKTQRLSLNRLRRNKALTLIELAMAIAFFVLGGIGIFGAYLSSKHLMEYGIDKMRAVDDAGNMLERIDETPYALVTSLFPMGVADGGEANDYDALVGGYTLDGQSITVTYPSIQNGRLEIQVTVSWLSRGRQHTLSVSTVKLS